MAGQVVLSAFVQVVLEKLASAALEELRLLRGLDGELEKLSSTLLAMHAVLEDAEEKQLKDKAVRDWLRKLKDVAYDADDVLDRFSAEALQSNLEGRSQGRWKKQI
uniref:Putative disease resistance protein RGA4 n=1 Tax=Anthurium amnicola TaxID=1678845 RepID=A0A1D1YU53_9ARAE